MFWDPIPTAHVPSTGLGRGLPRLCAGLGALGLEPPPVHPSVLLGRDQGWTGGGENTSLMPRLLSVAQG